MHKLERPQKPNSFDTAYTEFIQRNPPAQKKLSENERWSRWKHYQRKAYLAVQDCLKQNQHGLCAFCETKLGANNHEIEHFIPKSATTTQKDWTLTFENFTMSCRGNANKDADSYSDDPSHIANASCGHKKDNLDPSGIICNPYDLPKYPVIEAEYKTEGLFFKANMKACQRAGIPHTLIESTITHLGLNTPNLMKRRQKAWDALEKEVDSLRNLPEEERAVEFQKLGEDYLIPFNHELPSFYTTHYLCLIDDLLEYIPTS